jgi:hypothetical protein
MNGVDQNAAWVKQAQLDADRGVIECRVCRAKKSLAETVTLWRNGVLVFASCDACSSSHDLLMRPTPRGLEVRVHSRYPLVVGRFG